MFLRSTILRTGEYGKRILTKYKQENKERERTRNTLISGIKNVEKHAVKIVEERRYRWCEHVRRMENGRLPKMVVL